MPRYDFLVETFATERMKTLSAWSQVPDAHLLTRPEPRARTPLELMVHQCVSEDAWLTNLGITTGLPVTPADETRLSFLSHYAAASGKRLDALREKPESWFEEHAMFFKAPRSRAWILMRRIAHSAHHRGQLLAYLRIWGVPLYSTYGPTADTGGLPKNGAAVIYRYESVDDLLAHEVRGGHAPALPGPGSLPPTER